MCIRDRYGLHAQLRRVPLLGDILQVAPVGPDGPAAHLLVLGMIGKVVEQLRLQGENFPGHPRREEPGVHVLQKIEGMEEIQGVMKLIDEVYQRFGFAYEIELSTRPEKSIGADEEWALATKALEEVVKGMNKPYAINEGDGAFYGPKLDFHLKDSIGKTWQCGTIQLDFQFQVFRNEKKCV